MRLVSILSAERRIGMSTNLTGFAGRGAQNILFSAERLAEFEERALDLVRAHVPQLSPRLREEQVLPVRLWSPVQGPCVGLQNASCADEGLADVVVQD